MKIPKSLSPAAQAVDFAVHGPSPYATRRQIAAAALRAAIDQVVPSQQNYDEASHALAAACLNGMAYAASELRAIAAELEAQP